MASLIQPSRHFQVGTIMIPILHMKNRLYNLLKGTLIISERVQIQTQAAKSSGAHELNCCPLMKVI